MATELVQITRSVAQVMDSRSYRDGFSGDADTSSSLISVLRFVNTAINILCRAGLVQAETTIAASSGQWAYPTPTTAHKIVDVLYTQANGNPKPLREASLSDLNGRKRAWRETAGEPNVYIAIGTDTIYLYPVPNNTRNITIRYTNMIADLVASGDYPTGLPIAYHEPAAYIAAMLLVGSDLSRDGNQARLQYIRDLFETAFPDVAKIVYARNLFAEGSQQTRKEGGGMQEDNN
jgi:hypothetical protein